MIHKDWCRCLVCFISCVPSQFNFIILDSALVYFIKDGKYLPPKPHTTPYSATSAVGFNENATLPFEPGKTYRLRIVNTGAFNSLFFWIDGHELRIIEADGVCLIFFYESNGD